MEVDKEQGRITLTNTGNGASLIQDHWVRVARQVAPSERHNHNRFDLDLWHWQRPRNPEFFLRNADVLTSHVAGSKQDGYTATLKLDYASSEREGEGIVLAMDYRVSPEGWIDLDYQLSPRDATGHFTELGLALKVGDDMQLLRWVGNGPYESYPGQTEGERRGIYRVAPGHVTDPASRFFGGNRTGVDIAAITDAAGNGLGFLFDGATISLEHEGHGFVFTHVLRASGKGTKSGGLITEHRIPAAEITSEAASIRMVPLKAGAWPELFDTLLEGPHVLSGMEDW